MNLGPFWRWIVGNPPIVPQGHGMRLCGVG